MIFDIFGVRVSVFLYTYYVLVAFYDELSSLVRSIPKYNLLVIGGDMNAQIGKTETTNTAYTTRQIGMNNI